MSRAKLLEDLKEAVKLADQMSSAWDAYLKQVREANPHIVFDVEQANADIEDRMMAARKSFK